MNKHREIHGLDYSICLLVAAIYKTFIYDRRLGIIDLCITRGLNVEILEEDTRSPCHELRIRIRPVLWPHENFIDARFWQLSPFTEWTSFEGTVCLGGGEYIRFESHQRRGFIMVEEKP